MGFKSLISLQLIPWCFHVLGPTDPTPPPVRLVGPDGRVRQFDRPVPAAELMNQHPDHLLCRSDSFFIGRKIPALDRTARLEPGHVYFLLPSRFFDSVLNFLTLAASFSAPKPNPNPKMLRPFEIEKTECGSLRVRVSDDWIGEEEEEEESKRFRVCSTEALEREYREMVRRRRGKGSWKPKLETIREKKGKEKKRRKKKMGEGM